MNTKHLKAKILDLAIRGKLVPQNPQEGNATDLLKEHNDIPEEEIPFEIPKNWCWCKGNEIFSPMTSRRPKGEDFRYIDIESIDNKIQKIHHPKVLKMENAPSRASRETKIGDVVFSMVRPYLKNIARISEDLEDCIASTGFFVCRPKEFIDSKYCYYLMISSYVVNGLNQFMKGDNSPSINSDDITDFLYPLPTLSEQQRIVSAIEKAFEQIDIIEKNKLNLKTYIKQTKSKVLDLAIHGKLVEQIPQEGNAADLLQKIRDEKTELIKQKKLKEDKKSSFIIKSEDGKHYEHFSDGTLKDIEDEIPFEIPENWCWCRLRDIGIYKKGPFGSALTKSMFVSKNETTVKVYEQQNAIKKNHELGHYYIKGEYFESDMKGFEVHPGDIIVSCAGTIGETYILPENIEKGIINQALMKMTITKALNIQFFLMYFDHILKSASDDSGKGTAMKNIPPFDIFKQFLFPIPPLSEQKRIVERIEQIFEQFDALEKALGEQ